MPSFILKDEDGTIIYRDENDDCLLICSEEKEWCPEGWHSEKHGQCWTCCRD
ncbi:hypothetical protein VTI74DRAFT_2599 [Chaetomium olivicolor]